MGGIMAAPKRAQAQHGACRSESGNDGDRNVASTASTVRTKGQDAQRDDHREHYRGRFGRARMAEPSQPGRQPVGGRGTRRQDAQPPEQYHGNSQQRGSQRAGRCDGPCHSTSLPTRGAVTMMASKPISRVGMRADYLASTTASPAFAGGSDAAGVRMICRPTEARMSGIALMNTASSSAMSGYSSFSRSHDSR